MTFSMTFNQEQLKKIIEVHKKTLEQFQYYREAAGVKDETRTIADIIMDCDFESDDFNLGFEQGFIRGLESLLDELK